MTDFAEYDPGAWQEDGVFLFPLPPPVPAIRTKTLGKLARAVTTTVAVLAATTPGLAFQTGDLRAATSNVSICTNPIVDDSVGDWVPAGHWKRLRTRLRAAPVVPELDEIDIEPLV